MVFSHMVEEMPHDTMCNHTNHTKRYTYQIHNNEGTIDSLKILYRDKV